MKVELLLSENIGKDSNVDFSHLTETEYIRKVHEISSIFCFYGTFWIVNGFEIIACEVSSVYYNENINEWSNPWNFDFLAKSNFQGFGLKIEFCSKITQNNFQIG